MYSIYSQLVILLNEWQGMNKPSLLNFQKQRTMVAYTLDFPGVHLLLHPSMYTLTAFPVYYSSLTETPIDEGAQCVAQNIP